MMPRLLPLLLALLLLLLLPACGRKPERGNGSSASHGTSAHAKARDRAGQHPSPAKASLRKFEEGLKSSDKDLAMEAFHGLLKVRNELNDDMVRMGKNSGTADAESSLKLLDRQIMEACVDLTGLDADTGRLAFHAYRANQARGRAILELKEEIEDGPPPAVR